MTTPPRIPFPGPVQTDEGLDFDPDAATLPTQPGQWRYASGRFWVYDGLSGAFPLAPAAAPDFSKVLFSVDGTFMLDVQGDPLLLL